MFATDHLPLVDNSRCLWWVEWCGNLFKSSKLGPASRPAENGYVTCPHPCKHRHISWGSTISNLKNSGVKSQNPGEKGQNSERKKGRISCVHQLWPPNKEAQTTDTPLRVTVRRGWWRWWRRWSHGLGSQQLPQILTTVRITRPRPPVFRLLTRIMGRNLFSGDLVLTRAWNEGPSEGS